MSEVANFLASLYQAGYQYNSVNAYRSAISSVHEKVDGVSVGQHPTVTRLVKGIFDIRPPIPRYSNTWDGKGVAFIPTSLAKQSRQGRPIVEFYFPSLKANTMLCPVSTLSTYLDKTRPLRGEETRLFVSFVRPHKAVSSSTIARWLTSVLEQSGVDPSIFRAHSLRGASASAAARGGITTEDILKAANWSSESVFQRFYHKKVDKAAYGKAVINQNSLK